MRGVIAAVLGVVWVIPIWGCASTAPGGGGARAPVSEGSRTGSETQRTPPAAPEEAIDWRAVPRYEDLPTQRTRPELVEAAEPPIPEEKGITGTHGSFPVEMILGEDGRVEASRGTREEPERLQPLQRAAIEGVRNWRFRPIEVDGVPTRCRVAATLTFYGYSWGWDIPALWKGAEASALADSAGFDEAPRILKHVAPEIGGDVLAKSGGGSVWVEVTIDETGRVAEARVVDTKPEGKKLRDLEQASVAAARKWEFSPAMRDGVPVKSKIVIPFTYSLR